MNDTTQHTNMMFCRGCGQRLDVYATNCPHCGAPQTTTTPGSRPGEKSKVVAGVLALLLGGLGLHKFYTGAWGWGIVYIVLCWTFVPGIVALVEGIRYLILPQAEFQQKADATQGPFGFLW